MWVHVLVEKVYFYLYALLFLCFSRENAWTPSVRHKETKSIRHRKLIFIRHAESEWNNLTRHRYHPYNLFKLFVAECILLFKMDSIWLDSPLSALGEQQARAAAKSLALPSKALIVSSNLRRCVHTAGTMSAEALQYSDLHILSCLQEISRGVDTISLLEAHVMEKKQIPGFYARGLEFNVDSHFGNKRLFGTGLNRLNDFVRYVFERDVEEIIVYGHSHWFRCFFQEFTPSSHQAKELKIVNCGAFSFTLHETIDRHTDKLTYYVEPESIHSLSGGFEISIF